MSFAESAVEEVALQWFSKLGFAAKHGPNIASACPKPQELVTGGCIRPS